MKQVVTESFLKLAAFNSEKSESIRKGIIDLRPDLQQGWLYVNYSGGDLTYYLDKHKDVRATLPADQLHAMEATEMAQWFARELGGQVDALGINLDETERQWKGDMEEYRRQDRDPEHPAFKSKI